MLALIRRDITLALRSGGGFGLALAFFLILTLFVPFGVGPDRALLSIIAPGILWIGALLSCLLSLDRIFQLDAEDGTLEALATAPIPLTGIATAKAFAHWVTTGLPLTIASAPLGYLLGLPASGYLPLTLSLLSGTVALSFIGMFGAAVTVGIKRGGFTALPSGAAALHPHADPRGPMRHTRHRRRQHFGDLCASQRTIPSDNCTYPICRQHGAASQSALTIRKLTLHSGPILRLFANFIWSFLCSEPPQHSSRFPWQAPHTPLISR